MNTKNFVFFLMLFVFLLNNSYSDNFSGDGFFSSTHENSTSPQGPATVYGRILDRKTWRPIEGAFIDINGIISCSGQEGGFLISGLPLGKVTASIEADNYKPWLEEIVIVNKAQKLEISLIQTSSQKPDNTVLQGIYDFPTLSGPSGGIEVPGPYTVDTDRVISGIHFFRFRQKFPEMGKIPERVDHFDLITGRIIWGIAPDWEIGLQYMHKSLIGYPKYDIGTLKGFHAKYHVSTLSKLLPLSVGMIGGLSGNTFYFASTSINIPDGPELILSATNDANTNNTLVDWGLSLPINVPESLSHITKDKLSLIIEGMQGQKYDYISGEYGAKITSIFNWGLRFYRPQRSFDIIYRRDFSNDNKAYGIGGNMILW